MPPTEKKTKLMRRYLSFSIQLQKGLIIKLAIYGGSFDPPHIGHIAIIEAALKTLDIDKLLIIPTYLNPFKSEVYADALLRLKWMQKLTANYDKVEVLDIESSQNEPSPTFKTLSKLKLLYNFTQKPYLIIGADNLEHLHKWYKYDQLKEDVTFVVASRKNFKQEHSYLHLDVHCDISSSSLRKKLKNEELPALLADEIMSFYKEKNA